jgi:hypothetical protein
MASKSRRSTYDNKRSAYNMERILDAIEVLQYNKSERKVLYVPKKAYKVAKQMLKIKGSADEVTIKTY